jgi:hypothetical protein
MKIWRIEIHDLGRGVKKKLYLYFPHVLLDFGEIRYEKLAHDIESTIFTKIGV